MVWEVDRLKEIDKLVQKHNLSLATLFDSYDTNSTGVLEPHAFRRLVQALGADSNVELRPDDAQRLHEYICGSPSANMTRGDLEAALARARESATYGDVSLSYTGGADYMDDYWDSRDATLAGRPGFRPDLAPSSVINALTNYVPRMRDLLHSLDTRRSGTVTLHDFRRVLRRLGLQLDEADVDTFMLALDTTGRDSMFAYEPMLRWLSKRNQRLTNPALIAVLKRLAAPRVYPRLHQVLQQKIYRAGNYAGSDEISQDDLRDICTRLDVPMQQRELNLLAANYGGGRLLRVNALLAGISQVMRKDESLRKRWAASIMKRIVANLKQSGLTIRDSFYAYSRGDSMSMSDFRRFVENQGLRLTREEVDDLIRGTKAMQQSAMISYFDFRGIFAAAEKTHEGWGALGVHLKQKLLQQREFLLDTLRAADTAGSGTINRAQLRRVCSSHILSLSPSEIEHCISAAPTLNDGGSAGRADYAELVRGLGSVDPGGAPSMGISNRALPGARVAPNYDTSIPHAGAASAIGMTPHPIGGTGVAPTATAMAEAAAASTTPIAGMPDNVLGVPLAVGARSVVGGAFATTGAGLSVASMATGGAGVDAFGRPPIPPERQQQWQAGIESQLYHGSTTLNWMSQQAKDDLTAGESQWGGQGGSAVRTPAFSAWMTQIKVQLTQFVTHYDKVVQEIHERLGIFTVPTSVVDRLGMKTTDLGDYKKPTNKAAKKSYTPGTAGLEFKQAAKSTADMRIQELEVQLKDVRDHYIKKVRELHRKLEHYEYGGGASRDVALRDMEGVISHRDDAVMQQTRRAMRLQQQLVDALGAAHHAMWQAENHLTLTHADSSPSELMASSNVWEQNMRWLVRTLDTTISSSQATQQGLSGSVGVGR